MPREWNPAFGRPKWDRHWGMGGRHHLGRMPNHLHLALWPRPDGDVSRWMHWLMIAYVRRHLGRYRSSGHVWHGRLEAFPIQEDGHLLAVLRYIERNPLRAGLVGRAEEWRWSSLRWLSTACAVSAGVPIEQGTAPPRDALG